MQCVTLDKKPGVCHIGITEYFQDLIVIMVIADAGDQTKLAYRSLKLCDGLEAGIKGTLHAVQKWLSSLLYTI